MRTAISQVLSEVRAGLSIAEPHGSLIHSGEQSLIVLSKFYKSKLGKLLYLLEGDSLCYGIIKLNLPYKVRTDEFTSLTEKHKVTEKERVQWWPNKEVLYAYKFDIIESFKTPKKIKCSLSDGCFVERFEFIEKVSECKHHQPVKVSEVLYEKKIMPAVFSLMKSNKMFREIDETIKYMFESGNKKYAVEQRYPIGNRLLLMKVENVVKFYSAGKEIFFPDYFKIDIRNLSNRDFITEAELTSKNDLILSDILHFKGEDITGLHWYERKSLLHSFNYNHHIKEMPSLIVEDEDSAIQALTFLKNLEDSTGVIIKRYDSKYVKNCVNDNWLHLLNDGEEEVGEELEATTTSTTGISSVQAKIWTKKKKGVSKK